jgi:hypothetical protein
LIELIVDCEIPDASYGALIILISGGPILNMEGQPGIVVDAREISKGTAHS